MNLPKISVILRNGIPKAVILPDNITALVEIVRIDKDYEDCKQMEAYAEKLYRQTDAHAVPTILVRFPPD